MMLNLTNPKGLPLNGNQPAMPPHMAEALALVRAGRLQEATDLLMGNRSQGTAASADAAPEPSRPSERLSGLAARGMAGVQDVLNKLNKLNLCGENIWVPPVGGAAAQAASQYRAGPNAQAPAPSASEPGRFECVAFTHQGASHPYFLYTPKTAAPPDGRPLVLMLHGCMQDAPDFARGTRMNASAETAGALVLYPTQSQSANANGCWNWFRPEDQQAGAGEPALLLAMVQHTVAAQAVDAKRVYVAGLSAGGAMAAVLAQQHPEVFAALGVHSGLPAGAAHNMMGALSAMKSGAKGWRAPLPKNGARVVPLIVMHGDADTTVHQRNAAQLLQGAAAGIATTLQTQEQGASSDGRRHTRTCVVNPAVPGSVVAEHWLLHGAGHAWSGGDVRGSHASAHGVNASAEMLRFFLANPRGDASLLAGMPSHQQHATPTP
jgi:poly(hydroxyalkanoate) depolymerase family esterase